MRPSLTLTGARVLGPDGWTDMPVHLAGGRIADAPAGRSVDLDGFRVLPGIVDLHGDGFERHVAPRRGILDDVRPGLLNTDAELAANGITTAVLAQFWSWEGGLRGPDFAERVIAGIAELQPRVATDLRVQLRIETHLLDEHARAEALVARHGIGYVVWNDHLDHARLAAGRAPRQYTGQALKSGRSPESHLAFMRGLHARDAEVPGAVAALSERLVSAGVRLGSHDDRDTDTRAAWRARGAAIAEFPETRVAAEAARAAGDAVVMGAPNVVRGNSHKGNVSARDLVAAGLCDALASDYHYPALLWAVRRLVADGVLDWQAAWRLVSEGPARVLGLADRGRIAPGLRADLVVLDSDDRIGATIAGGVVSHMQGAVAARFLA
ncbi:alpha-D-ribose 1-methylphosphonate 5-triphosphate diphosphatase [Roseivivax isoporae]|uniref:Phosphonate metabolism protein PhnM n=1 Tax=Roseivivax isoporae LMG 25204 TaxID=1449351 RepID=X7FDF2_9RHOB|nr:alpha-D-ribose 1-methylphosphonate 5-triphosphate diphosphatase [Roseivivax isoporae]ETX30101.1 phosphonate metabolism protein PhnM [Roseivivax isoporae LMG 25204]